MSTTEVQSVATDNEHQLATATTYTTFNTNQTKMALNGPYLHTLADQ